MIVEVLKKYRIVILLVVITVTSVLLLVYLSRFDYWIGDYKYHFYLDRKEAHIVEYRGKDEALYVPDKIGPFPVVYVDMNVFDGIDTIKEVHVTNTPQYVIFSDLGEMNKVFFDERISSFDYDFNNCNKITKIIFPEGLQEISGGFPNCSSLVDVYLPKSVSRISLHAFIGTQFEEDHSNDKYYVAGNGVLVFCNVNLNEDVVIPSGVKNCCVSLVLEKEHSDRKIFFPETLERINNIVFAGDIFYFGGEEFTELDIYGKGGLIVAPADSPMAKYCKENNINFRPMTEEEEKEWREKTEAAASEITYQEE